MRHPVPTQMPRHPIARDAPAPRLIDDVVQRAHLVVPPHLLVPVPHRLQRVVLPPRAHPAVAEEVRQEVLVWELVGAEQRGGVEGVDHGRPQRRRGVEEEEAAVQERVRGFGAGDGDDGGNGGGVALFGCSGGSGWCEAGRMRHGRRRRQRGGMAEARVRAVLRPPVRGRPAVAVEVAHARMVRGQPVRAGQVEVEDFVHVTPEHDVRVEEDDGVPVRQLEDPQLAPCVFEAGRDERDLVVGAGEEGLDGHDAEERCACAFELERAVAGGWEGGRGEDEEGVGGLVSEESVGEDEDPGEVGGPCEERCVGAFGAGADHCGKEGVGWERAGRLSMLSGRALRGCGSVENVCVDFCGMLLLTSWLVWLMRKEGAEDVHAKPLMKDDRESRKRG